MTSPDWLAWSTAHGFSLIEAPGAEKTRSHSSGYEFVEGLVFCQQPLETREGIPYIVKPPRL